MALFLDCFDPAKIEEVARLGIIAGVTTNPKLISHERERFNLKERICRICAAVDGPVAVAATAPDVDGMVAQAREFHSWNPGQVVVKVPVSAAGYAAIAKLQKLPVATMATCIMTFAQGYAAALAGARYLALFWSRMKEAGNSPENAAALLNERIENEKLSSRILAASLREPDQAEEALAAGVHIVTVSPEILERMLKHPGTDESIAEFAEDWRCARERGLMG